MLSSGAYLVLLTLSTHDLISCDLRTLNTHDLVIYWTLAIYTLSSVLQCYITDMATV
jgi:hypothetical protein